MNRQTQASDPFYHTSRWQKLRASVLRRDGYQCQWSKRYSPFAKEATLVHHIFPRQWWPEYQYESWNLISLSKSAHEQMHSRGTDLLSEKGMDLLIRTARKRGMDLKKEMEKYESKTSASNGMESVHRSRSS